MVSPGVHSLAATSLNNVSIQWRIEDFPEWGPTLEFGLKPYYLSRFLPKLHEYDRNWTQRFYLDPPMVYFHLRNFLSTSPKMKRYLCDNVVYLSNVGTNLSRIHGAPYYGVWLTVVWKLKCSRLAK